MKQIKNCGFQGDVMFLKVSEVPEGIKEEKKSNSVIVAHSETGHNHVVEGKAIKVFHQDAMTCFLMLDTPAEVVHHRPWDTHEALGLGKGIWKVKRQREHTPEGWRRVED